MMNADTTTAEGEESAGRNCTVDCCFEVNTYLDEDVFLFYCILKSQDSQGRSWQFGIPELH